MITSPKRSLKILITAGPTREPIDKVRFLSNASTGRMGYELARQALRRGHRIILISGPTHILPPKSKGAEFVPVTTALQMRDKVKKYFKHCDCLIMTAAVSDFRARKAIDKKIKKADFKQSFSLKLVKNPDILLEIGRRKGGKVLVGFALETGDLIKNARAKLKEKNLDLIVANQLTPKSSPFGDKKVKAVLINCEGTVSRQSFLTKRQLARQVLRKTEKIFDRCGAIAKR